MKIVKKIATEFWLPLTLSILWVLYNVYGGIETETWDLSKTVNVFGPTFFLLSWLTGQFYRIKKQTKVEDNFGTIESRLNELLDKVETKTEEMVSQISGGKSFPWFQIGMIDHTNDVGVLMALNEGNHPLYDVTARIVDLEKFRKLKNNITLATLKIIDVNVDLGNMIPSHSRMYQKWDLRNSTEFSYNIFSSARNGNFVQQLRLIKINGKWVSATKVLKDNVELHLLIDESFPKDREGKITWD